MQKKAECVSSDNYGDYNKDFHERLIAAQVLQAECAEYGINLPINADGSITLYHGTSSQAAEKIKKEGFWACTCFSHSKSFVGYGDEGPEWYANVKHNKGRVFKIHADARLIDFASGSGEFYSTNRMKYNEKTQIWQLPDYKDKNKSAISKYADKQNKKNSTKGEAQKGEMTL